MAVFDWPTADGFTPSRIEFGPNPGTLVTQSVLSGGIQTTEVPGKRWSASMQFSALPNTAQRPALRRYALEGFLDSLNGQAERVRLWHMGRRGLSGWGTPAGTINTTGVTLGAAAAQFAGSITLAGCGATKTLLAGDFLKIGGQLIMCPATATSDAGGAMTVSVPGRVRSAVASGAAVTLIKPTATFILATPNWRQGYLPGMAQELALDFVEWFE